MDASDTLDFQLSSYDYILPEERIAQDPVTPRDHARLLLVNSPTTHAHHHFYDLATLLNPGDLLVMNNTRVIPARLYGHKVLRENGAERRGSAVEILLLEQRAAPQWLALVRPGRRLKPGAEICFDVPTGAAELDSDAGLDPSPPQSLRARVLAADPDTSGRLLEFLLPPGLSLQDCLAHWGHIPLPPYISASHASTERYQTIYSEVPGAVAAPTAGLHFTPEGIAQLEQRGIEHCFVTLHVGVGTFRPVEVEHICDHQMHAEWVNVSVETVAKIEQTKARGGRVIAVGTTVARSLEGAAQSGTLMPLTDKVNLFIHPGYRWRVIDGLITNFHLPKSSLMMLVSALIGRERLLALYHEAIAQNYRFYSFGDAMLILPEARCDRMT